MDTYTMTYEARLLQHCTLSFGCHFCARSFQLFKVRGRLGCRVSVARGIKGGEVQLRRG